MPFLPGRVTMVEFGAHGRRGPHMTTLYRTVIIRRWKAIIQDAAGPLVQLRDNPETTSLNQYGVRLLVYEAYARHLLL
jgi:hypothetical protein